MESTAQQPTRPDDRARYDNIVKAADQGSESILCRISHTNRYGLTPSEFDSLQFQLRELILSKLTELDDSRKD